MKKFMVLAAAVAALFVGKAEADLLYSSALTSPPLSAGNLAGQDGWEAHSGAGNLSVQIGATGTTLEHGAGSREDVNRSFAAISAGQTYYFGLDVIVNGGSENAYFAHFKNTGTDFTTRVFVTAAGSGGDFTFGLSPAGSAPEATWASDFSFGSTNRIIGSYNADSLEVRLWVNATSESDTFLTLTDSAANAVSAFALRQAGGSSSQLVSNLRVATSFQAAAIPEPSSGLIFVGSIIGFGAMLRRRS